MKHDAAIEILCECIDTRLDKEDKKHRDGLLWAIGSLVFKGYQEQKKEER